MIITKNDKRWNVVDMRLPLLERLKAAYRAGRTNLGLNAYLGKFWGRVMNGDFEDATYRVFDRFLDANHSYIDIGAWFGPTVLYAAQIAKHCYAYEPDPASYVLLKKNLALNPEIEKKVTAVNAAVWNRDGEMTLKTPAPLFGIGSLVKQQPVEMNVRCETFPEIVDCNFVKIDAEGAEVEILESMQRFIIDSKPTIFLSLHPKNRDDLWEGIKPTLIRYNNVYFSSGGIAPLPMVEKMITDKIQPIDLVLTDEIW